jgi:uncharacterized protein YukE
VADELEVRPDSLSGAGRDLQQVAQRLQSEWQAMTGTAQGMGDIFGDDMVSSLIATSYQSAQEIANDSYTSAVEGFQDFGGGLQEMAATYAEAEQETTGDVRQVGEAI